MEITVKVSGTIETPVSKMHNYEAVGVSFGSLFQSLYASYQLVKDNKELLDQWANDNTLIVIQGDIK